MRLKNTEIKSLDYIPLTLSYISNLGAIFLLIHQYNMWNNISSASMGFQIGYWIVNVIFGSLFILSVLLLVMTHPQELKNR
jgi:uncharacterized membrane protein